MDPFPHPEGRLVTDQDKSAVCMIKDLVRSCGNIRTMPDVP